jgi:hypothetical protein
VVVEDDERFAHRLAVEGVEHKRMPFRPRQQTQIDFTLRRGWNFRSLNSMRLLISNRCILTAAFFPVHLRS